MNDGECSRPGIDPEIFFPVEDGERPDLSPQDRRRLNQRNEQAARLLCDMCPVREACLEENLLEPYGIFAGLGRRARRQLAAQRGIPWPGVPTFDHAAVERVVGGRDDSVELRRVDKLVAITRLLADKVGANDIVRIVGVHHRDVARLRDQAS